MMGVDEERSRGQGHGAETHEGERCIGGESVALTRGNQGDEPSAPTQSLNLRLWDQINLRPRDRSMTVLTISSEAESGGIKTCSQPASTNEGWVYDMWSDCIAKSGGGCIKFCGQTA